MGEFSRCDALVVGAGPAGLMFSRQVAEKGFRVLVVEKEGRLGVKPCGEGISSRVLETAGIPRSEASRFVAQEIRRARIVAPNGKEFVIGGGGKVMGYTIDKPGFLRVMAEYAADAGAGFVLRERVRDILRVEEGFRVVTPRREIRTSLLVGADGYLSVVSRRLGFEKRGDRKLIPSVQYLMAGVELEDREATYFYLGREVAPLGYAWIFPKDGGLANVGLGVQGAPPLLYLNKFVRSHKKKFARASPIEFGGAAVTISGSLRKVVGDNVMLIGEAAGHVIPLTGGGIHTSIAAGKIAGEVAAAALEQEDLSAAFLKRYRDEYDAYWGRRIRDSGRVLGVVERLTDEELNQLAEVLEPRDVLDLANGVNIVRVASKLLKHPIFSAKIASKLLR